VDLTRIKIYTHRPPDGGPSHIAIGSINIALLTEGHRASQTGSTYQYQRVRMRQSYEFPLYSLQQNRRESRRLQMLNAECRKNPNSSLY